MRGVAQQEFEQVGRAGRAVDRPSEPALHEERQRARVIDMRVRQYHRVDARRGKRKVGPVTLAQVFEPLELAAVEQDLFAAECDEVPRASDGPRGTTECQGRSIAQGFLRPPPPPRLPLLSWPDDG